MIVLAVITAGIGVVLILALSSRHLGVHDIRRLSLAVNIPLWLIPIPVSVRRLHDRDKSGWWLLLFYGLGIALSLLSPALHMHAVTLGATWVSLAVGLWGFIEMGFLPGSPGGNRFGPNPLLRATRGALA